jgi:hypothetical protein
VLNLSQKYGTQQAVEFANFEAANVRAVKTLIEKEKIDCDFHLTRSMDVYLDASHAKVVEEGYYELQRQGVANLQDVMFQCGEKAEEVC